MAMVRVRSIRKSTKRGVSFVYAKPSFLEGMARLFDIGGTLDTYYYYLPDDNPQDADARAIASDWQAVGRDIAFAIDEFSASQEMLAARRRR